LYGAVENGHLKVEQPCHVGLFSVQVSGLTVILSGWMGVPIRGGKWRG